MIRLRRSILSVPGSSEKMISKALALAADEIMLDLEDGVAVGEKESAREKIVRAFVENDWQGRTRAFRINGLNTPFAYRDIIDVVERAGNHLDLIVVPKVECEADIRFVELLLDQIEMRHGISSAIGIEASIETARGMLNIEEIAFSSPRLESLVFGIADYSASLNMPSRGISGHGDAEEAYPGHRYHFPMSRLVMTAKAAGLAAIDAPYGDFRDQEGLENSCRMAASLGFDGKWAIHPAQLATINRTFTPSAEDISRAQRILQAYKEAEVRGEGATSLDGKMVDGASIRLARIIHEQARRLGLLEADADH
ncbi:MAG: CoA ester lyase [Deltaproteobacteria bacterium]|nr:CoA ester lyase [Deltaproteobacteria bacterium]MBW2072380.1 CoA ester lyase [Deltaproteobacteria bacterium]